MDVCNSLVQCFCHVQLLQHLYASANTMGMSNVLCTNNFLLLFVILNFKGKCNNL